MATELDHNDDELLTREEVAKMLGMSLSTLRRLGEDGPPVLKLSTRKHRYKRSAVHRWLDNRSAGCTRTGDSG
jgi:excisionase family DNA binding protein